MAKQENLQLPFTVFQVIKWFFTAVPIIVGAVYYYAKFENKIDGIEASMVEAKENIEELMQKHITAENKRFEELEEELSWYQKDFNINPFRKKKDK